MTKNRFEVISQFLHFSDSTQEPQRGDANNDRLFKVRAILSRVHENIQAVYEPSKIISIDEGMIAFKGRLSFRQYIPAKPTKYGIKVWMAQTLTMAMWQTSLFTLGARETKVMLTA